MYAQLYASYVSKYKEEISIKQFLLKNLANDGQSHTESLFSLFLVVGKANIGFLVDGRIKKHLPMLQRWIANLIFLFARGSYISVGTYGGSVNVVCCPVL